MKVVELLTHKDQTYIKQYGVRMKDDSYEWMGALEWCHDTFGFQHFHFDHKSKTDTFYCWFAKEDHRTWFLLRWS